MKRKYRGFTLCVVLTCASFCAYAQAENAGNIIPMRPELTLEMAQKMADASLAMARTLNVEQIAITVAGTDGRPIVTLRTANCKFQICDWAEAKAETSWLKGKRTLDLGDALRILTVKDSTLIMGIGGGAPVLLGGTCVGGIGVSGAPHEIDQQIADAGAEFFNQQQGK